MNGWCRSPQQSAAYSNIPISNWDVSQVTNMGELFKDRRNFNDDISNWDVSSVTNISYMFYNAEKL